jgi:N-acyl homoserine lactone hydrolase
MTRPFDTRPELAASDVDLVICGFPGKSARDGGLVWSTVALLRTGRDLSPAQPRWITR